MQFIRIRGARQYHLKNIDLDIPRNKLVVMTGLSGSGKSTLAFDTIYAEGQRRYVESLSSYARQFLERMPKPDVDFMEGLSPAIAIEQKQPPHNPRSTVGTITEIHDFLRLLFARAGTAHCHLCGRPVTSQSIDQMVDTLMTYRDGSRMIIMSPLIAGQKGTHLSLIKRLKKDGFARLRIDGAIVNIEGIGPLSKDDPHTIEVVVDRIIIRHHNIRNRLTDSLELALKLSNGRAVIDIPDHGPDGSLTPPIEFNEKATCSACGISYPDFSPSSFSFNSPHGACPQCDGLGSSAVLDQDLKKEVRRYMRFQTCPACLGARLRPESRAVKIGGMSIHEISGLTISRAIAFFRGLSLNGKNQTVSEKISKEVLQRLEFLQDVGLSYLTLDRSANTLSGGESQRIHLATQIGARLTGVLYVLDEPSIGLHPKDNHRLLQTLLKMRDMGNSVLVVEHDRDTIMASDYVIDMGPEAGINGGQVVFKGPPQSLLSDEQSLTGRYFSGRIGIPVPGVRRKGNGKHIIITHAGLHNLKHIRVSFPLGCLICVTGVSGSGKSSLVINTLYDALREKLNQSGSSAPSSESSGVEFLGLEHIDKVINIDQSPIGRTPRSNPATYTGVFNLIRDLFSKTPDARMRGYSRGRFSSNVKGGRCEACQGDGMIKIEMHFLPDIYVPCDVCNGRRYNRETLEVRYKGRNIAEVLNLTVNQALQLFNRNPGIRDKLQTLVDVGLGYIHLGQTADTLSGGEAQRVKLARELSKKGTGHTLYILDEPTTGLHIHDINTLLQVLNRLVDNGNTVIVIEHNLDVIKSADHIIDLGPDGGDGGGYLIGCGTPEEIAAIPGSYTGQYLADYLFGVKG